VLADTTRFRISLRTAPTQRPEQAAQALADFLIAHAPQGARVEVTPGDMGMGWAMDADSPVVRQAEEAMRQAFGRDPVNKGEGGSIPFIPELKRLFPEAQVLVTGPRIPSPTPTARTSPSPCRGWSTTSSPRPCCWIPLTIVCSKMASDTGAVCLGRAAERRLSLNRTNVYRVMPAHGCHWTRA